MISFVNRINRSWDKALVAMKGMRRGIVGSGKKRSLKDELLNTFSASKKLKKYVWKHRFVCLAYFEQQRIPTTDGEKDELIKAGLGEKCVEFSSLNLNGQEINNVLISAFPRLKDGGFFDSVDAFRIVETWNHCPILFIILLATLKKGWGIVVVIFGLFKKILIYLK